MKAKIILLFSILSIFLTSQAYAAWDSDKPAAGDDLADSQADIQGNFAAIEGGIALMPVLRDDDGDTKIQVEEGADEDKIRLDIATVEMAVFGDGTNEEAFKLTNPGTTTGFKLDQTGQLAAPGFLIYTNYAGAHADYLFKVHGDHISNTASLCYIDNDGTGTALAITADKLLDASDNGLYVDSAVTQTNSPLVYFFLSDGDSDQPTLKAENDGDGPAVQIDTAANGAHMLLTPISTTTYATEGGVYSDTEDGVLYYRSSSAWAACNADADFSETFGTVGMTADYEEGDVVVISTEEVSQAKKDLIKEKAKIKNKYGDYVVSDRKEKRLLVNAMKIEKSSSPYQTNVVGVVSFRSTKNWQPTDAILVGLTGKVACKVNNENGNIAVGDLLTTSSIPGEAMKATIDSFDKIGSIIGKAREDFNGSGGVIEILVGIK